MNATGVGQRFGTVVPRSPSEALMIECARPAAVTEPSRAITVLAPDPDVAWTSTFTRAAWHGVAPRLARSLVVSGATHLVPASMDEQLQSAYLSTMARNLALQRELERVVGELRHHQVDVMLLKGAALTPLVHRDLGVRPMDDLDLLVHPGDLALADQVIKSLGYVASASPPVADTGHGSGRVRFSPHHLPALVRADGRVTIELHHKLGSSGSVADFDVAGLWTRAVPCMVGAVDCSRPPSEDLLAHLCLHFLVDRVRLFSRRALGQLCDVAATVDALVGTLEWDTLARDAADRGYSRALALALGTAALIPGIRIPDAIPSMLAPDAAASPDAADVVARRVLRDPAWTTLERLTSRQPSVLHLLPPSPGRWLSRADATRPTYGMAEGYARWTGASARIVVRPGEIAAERRFSAALQALVYPHGLPDGSTSRRRFRHRLQARLARAPVGSPPAA